MHLTGPVEIERFLQSAARLLQRRSICTCGNRRAGTRILRGVGDTGDAEGMDNCRGNLILQILNYDYLLEERLKKLPLIETSQLRFEREYSYNTGDIRVVFTTRLHLKQSNKTYEDSVELYPLRRGEMEELLENTGFSQIQYFGDFDGTPLTPESFPLIAVAESTTRASSSI